MIVKANCKRSATMVSVMAPALSSIGSRCAPRTGRAGQGAPGEAGGAKRPGHCTAPLEQDEPGRAAGLSSRRGPLLRPEGEGVVAVGPVGVVVPVGVEAIPGAVVPREHWSASSFLALLASLEQLAYLQPRSRQGG